MFCAKKVLFGVLIYSWSSYSNLYAVKACNVKPTSTYPPWNAHRMLTELLKLFECVYLGRSMLGDLEQHGWTPVQGKVPFKMISLSKYHVTGTGGSKAEAAGQYLFLFV